MYLWLSKFPCNILQTNWFLPYLSLSLHKLINSKTSTSLPPHLQYLAIYLPVHPRHIFLPRDCSQRYSPHIWKLHTVPSFGSFLSSVSTVYLTRRYYLLALLYLVCTGVQRQRPDQSRLALLGIYQISICLPSYECVSLLPSGRRFNHECYT